MKKIIFISMLFSFFLISCGFNDNNNDDLYLVPFNNDSPHEDLEKKIGDKCLVMMYADGDNNLYDVIYNNVVQAAKGYQLTNEKILNFFENFSDITISVLWDGRYDTSFYTGDTKLLEIKNAPDFSENDYLTITNFAYDLTESYGSSFIQKDSNGKYEADMSDYTTLQNYLFWCKSYYTDYDTAILIFLDHGAGSGGSYNITSNSTRNICTDDTTGTLSEDKGTSKYGSTFITTDETSKAIKNAGWNYENLDLIMYDTCLTGTIEEAWELMDCAKAMIASPDEIPGNGNDYEPLIYNLKKNTTLKELGQKIISNYAEDYRKFSSYHKATLSFYDLSYLRNNKDTAVSAINSFEEYLVSNYSNSSFFEKASYSYKNRYSEKYFSGFDSYFYTALMNSMFYDLGYFTDRLLCYFPDDTGLSDCCENVRTLLENLIVVSWNEDNKNFDIKGTFPEINDERNYYGINIAGNKETCYSSIDIYSDTTFAFNTDTNWGTFFSTFGQ